MKQLIDKLVSFHEATDQELIYILENMNEETRKYLYAQSNKLRTAWYGNKVYMRGLIEFTNYCKNNCLYCGIQANNKKVKRYRLSKEEILRCCEDGYRLGYHTFVLQGGEDLYYSDDRMVDLIQEIKNLYPDCAVTLSIGEKPYESYQAFFQAGADRYLLRHETYNQNLYQKLHPNMNFNRRIECLYDLKSIGYQVGSGFMVGLPGQTAADYASDLLFLKKLEPHMVGIGPFIPQSDTLLANASAGTAIMTCDLLALIRILLPSVLLPATTALGSIDPKGREKGLKAGANVVMPNLSPTTVRDQYALYDGKICTGDEAAHCRQCIEGRINAAGFKVDMGRGDHISKSEVTAGERNE